MAKKRAPWRDPLWGVQNARERRRGRAAQQIANDRVAIKKIEGALASAQQVMYRATPTGVRLFFSRLIFTLKRIW
jgi:hypothetical protein